MFNVLSLFDGMSCGQIALNRAGIHYDNYYASEIDKHAIAVTKKNYPSTIHLGSVVDVVASDLPKIDLLLGGSPCQGFSFAGKQLNFDDPRSALFFEYTRLLRELNPKYFLLENVNMKKEYLDVITEYLGIEGVLIDSADFSAQGRKRYYWTNIPLEYFWSKSSLTTEDVLEDSVDEKYFIDYEKQIQVCENDVLKGKITVKGLDVNLSPIYEIHGNDIKYNTPNHPPMPCITPQRVKKRQNGRRFKPPKSKFYTLTAQDLHGVLVDGRIRLLTPIEYERLQTVPDNYTDSVSDSQRYKMLGNGWTVDVISHIFKGLL